MKFRTVPMKCKTVLVGCRIIMMELIAEYHVTQLVSFSRAWNINICGTNRQELCRTAWALGRLAGGHDGVGSYASAFDGGGGDAEGTAEEDGAASSEEISKPGGELRGLLEKLLGECSKWLELFTPQVQSCLLFTHTMSP